MSSMVIKMVQCLLDGFDIARIQSFGSQTENQIYVDIIENGYNHVSSKVPKIVASAFVQLDHVHIYLVYVFVNSFATT